MISATELQKLEAQQPSQGVELSVIVPTFNERDNVAELVRRLRCCLAAVHWEVIFVDDSSPDGTAKLVRDIGRRDGRVRCIQRIARRGLSSATIEGMLASSAPYIAVMDGDLQHDESLLPLMLTTLETEQTDVVIGTRYAIGGGVSAWDQTRVVISQLATLLSRTVLKADISDPMSGFFLIRREAIEASVPNLSGIGFKILVDLFASSPRPLKFSEVPYEFRTRVAGESKLDSQVAWNYLMLLLDKRFGHIVPARLAAFCLVGGIGVVIHFAVLAVLLKQLGQSFIFSQSIATLTAMTSNFVFNNIFTYRDMRLKAWQWISGWGSFTLVCGVGALANVGMASYLNDSATNWGLAAFAGILVGSVWNFTVTKNYTWKS